MEIVTELAFSQWSGCNGIELDKLVIGEPSFKNDFSFRVPIGDYTLQLDCRINAVFLLLRPSSSFWILKRTPWRFGRQPLSAEEGMLECVFQATGVPSGTRVLLFSPEERFLAQAFCYLTNRWGGGLDESLYVISNDAPDYIIYCCAHPESLFVKARTLELHDIAVAELRQKKIPAFGSHIKSPYTQEPYKNIEWMGKVLEVDRQTGKIIGAGSDEAALRPEFLPPRDLPKPGSL